MAINIGILQSGCKALMLGIGAFLYVIFISIAWIMTCYTLNFHYLSYQSLRNLKHKKYAYKKDITSNSASLPIVTIQLPLYNEKYVAARLINSVCQIDYPKEKLQIQILDDSDDDTTEIIKVILNDYKLRGFDIAYIHRRDRSGYKAGALKAGMKYAKGEFIAIFDADFIPPSDFLKKAIGNFADPKLGLVQCRWGHVNEGYSTLTEAQAISLDLHFLIEQKAKSLTHLFMNFNGAAGVWRTLCIQDAGGWHTSTLVEDLDLSYRAQLKGWKCLFLEDVIVAAELPVQMNAAKRQQFRWAKGSVQVALKLLLDVMLQKKIPLDTKIQAFIQLTRHFIHPLFLTQFLIFPILLTLGYELYGAGLAPVVGILIYILTGPFSYLYMIRKIWRRKWRSKARQYIFLIFFAAGISVNNTVAIFDALLNSKSEFLRTPKFGILKKEEGWKDKSYALPFTKTILLEIFFSLYGCIAIFISIFSRNPIFLPIIIIQTIGFIYVAYLGILHSSKKSFTMRQQSMLPRRVRELHYDPKVINMRLANKRTDTLNTTVFDKTMIRKTSLRNRNSASNMNTRYYRIILVGILGFIAFGAGMAYYGYQQTIYPIDKATGYLSRAETSQTPEMLLSYIRHVQQLLPKQGNPVWSFSTPTTDFGLIQSDLAAMISRANSISSLEPHTSAYNTGLQDIHASIKVLETNLQEATPYLYVSFTNVLLSIIWIAIIVFIFAIMKKGRARFREYEAA
jgi:cellulose synthase/poly-beta-1,6-N-acetylglucosamine synthase-like glycosyltransferase